MSSNFTFGFLVVSVVVIFLYHVLFVSWDSYFVNKAVKLHISGFLQCVLFFHPYTRHGDNLQHTVHFSYLVKCRITNPPADMIDRSWEATGEPRGNQHKSSHIDINPSSRNLSPHLVSDSEFGLFKFRFLFKQSFRLLSNLLGTFLWIVTAFVSDV